MSDLYEMHRTLWSACPGGGDGGPGRILFRVDSGRSGPTVIVQSEHAPNWSALPDEYLSRPAETKPLVLTFTAGQRLRFRLRANPVQRGAAKNQRLGNGMAGEQGRLPTARQPASG